MCSKECICCAVGDGCVAGHMVKSAEEIMKEREQEWSGLDAKDILDIIYEKYIVGLGKEEKEK